MICYLFVKDSFLEYLRGDVITDIGEVHNILSSDYKRFVTRVALPQTSKG